MNTVSTFSRRHFTQGVAATGIAVVGVVGGNFSLLRPVLAQNGDNQRVCNSDNVNIRDIYGFESTIIGTLNDGDIVDVLGEPVDADGYTWLNVYVTGKNVTGWAASEFFSNGGSGWPAGTAVHVSSDSVNLRSGAGTDKSILGTFDNGANATIVAGPQSASGYVWYQISIDGPGTTGWMVSDFLEAGHTNQGFPAGAAVVTTSSVNLRTGAGTGYGVIAVYSAGEFATVIEGPVAANGYQWYKVELVVNGNIGWFAGEFLKYGQPQPSGEQFRVVDGPLNVRETPSLSGAILIVAPTGATGKIVGDNPVQANGYTWVNVEFFNQDNTLGWVVEDFLEFI